MDWERTINIFIIAFLVLNLAFVFQLWLLPVFFDSSNYVSPEQIQATLEELEYSGIAVTAKVPRRMKRLQLLGVSNVLFREEEVAASLIGEKFERVASGAKSEYRSALGEVDIYVDGRIHYLSALPPENGDIAISAARKRADQFLEDTVGRPRDSIAGKTAASPDGTWAVEYIQRWHGKELEVSSIVVVVDQSGSIIELDYYWVEVMGYAGESLLSIPATAALTVAAEKMPAGATITGIYISWYGMPGLADQWRASPVWVVETEGGSKYYVNAQTGELEGERQFPGRKTLFDVE
ncbi:MAG TPA: hypothetical protein DG577_07255 [Firmicutes bacterium]|nr:hypothetical protein [Bacillota bacterium]